MDTRGPSAERGARRSRARSCRSEPTAGRTAGLAVQLAVAPEIAGAARPPGDPSGSGAGQERARPPPAPPSGRPPRRPRPLGPVGRGQGGDGHPRGHAGGPAPRVWCATSVVAYFFGAQADTDAFFLAYKIPYLLTLIVVGALTATFVPLFSYRLATGRKQEAWDLSVNIGNIIAVVLVVVERWCWSVIAPWIIPLVGLGSRRRTTVDKGVFLFRILMIGFVFEGLTGLVIGHAQLAAPLRAGRLRSGRGHGGHPGHHDRPRPQSGHHVPGHRHAWSAGWSGFAVLCSPDSATRRSATGPASTGTTRRVREVGGMVWPILIGSAVGKVSIFVDQILGSLLEEGVDLEPQLRRQAVPAPPGAVRRRDNRPHLPPALRAGGRQGSRAGQGHPRLRPAAHGLPPDPGHRGHHPAALPHHRAAASSTASSPPTTPPAPPGPCSSSAWASTPTPGATR